MKKKQLSLLDRCIDIFPLSVLRRAAPRRLIALLYHLVSDHSVPHVRNLYAYKTVEAFKRDLAYVKENYHVVSHEDVCADREGEAKLPPRSLTITFDDGFRECFGIARPLLLEHQIPCTFFLISGAIDNSTLMFRNKVSLCLEQLDGWPTDTMPTFLQSLQRELGIAVTSREEVREKLTTLTYHESHIVDRVCELFRVDIKKYLAERQPYMSRAEILRLYNDGFTIGAHSVNHPQMWFLEDPSVVVREIVDSCAAIRDLTGQQKVPFAFPFNGLSLDRHMLADIRRRNPFVCLMYDSNNLMRDREFIVNRIDCDVSHGTHGTESNIPFLLKQAHAREPARRCMRWRHGRALR